MDKITKLLNTIFLIIIGYLSIMSAIAIITTHWTLFKTTEYSISFEPSGIDYYLSTYGKYKTLFTATITTIAAYLGLLKLKAATDANKDKLKQDRFNEWKAVLDIRFLDVEQANPIMKREFIKIRYNLFCQLLELNFKISNKEELTRLFITNFKGLINLFETSNKYFNKYDGIYPDYFYSYSFLSFGILFIGCIDDAYPEINNDLKLLYLSEMSQERTFKSLTSQENSSISVDIDDI